ncbi:hypothetical protein ACFQJD_07525 [Haloplanus sp. GCM10025708]|uniref:hypothetical protein n=1 Tax=Haloplanus sp. GCM10025708 TaxID=3252679 RepID=UPI003607B584
MDHAVVVVDDDESVSERADEVGARDGVRFNRSNLNSATPKMVPETANAAA